MSQQSYAERVARRLRILRWSAWIDLILLIALVASALSNQRDFVHVLGPLHGINFLLLVAIAATAALDGLWSWWFPLAVFFTGGALGALIGERIIKRRIETQSTDHEDKAVFPANGRAAENVIITPDMPGPLGERKERA